MQVELTSVTVYSRDEQSDLLGEEHEMRSWLRNDWRLKSGGGEEILGCLKDLALCLIGDGDKVEVYIIRIRIHERVIASFRALTPRTPLRYLAVE